MKKTELLNLKEEEILDLARKQNIFKKTVDGTNMLNALISNFNISLLYKVIQSNPKVLNEHDNDGCILVERLADKEYFSILENFAEYIDLTKSSYDGNKNMLGYLASKNAVGTIFKALNYNPSVINDKDSSGTTGTERLADKKYFSVLESFAEHIDLTRTSYDGNKNMLGYLIEKEAIGAICKTLKINPSVINDKDPSGTTGTERLADKKYFSVLESFAEHIDLTRTSYDEEKNMLGYLIKKEATGVVLKALSFNSSAINVKDPVGANGTERLVDKGYFSILNRFKNEINWSQKTYNEDSTLRYVLKKSSISDGIEYIKIASKNYSETLNQELDLIIQSNLIKAFEYKEVSSKINKNKKINGVNLLTVLSNKGLDKYIEIILNGNSFEANNQKEVKENTLIVDKIEEKQIKSSDTNSLLEAVKKSKSLIIDRIKKVNNEIETKSDKEDSKSQFKSML